MNQSVDINRQGEVTVVTLNRPEVRNAVGALPGELREVIVMKEFEDMTFQEISETLELPLSTVKSRLYTALKQLKMKLERTPVEVV